MNSQCQMITKLIMIILQTMSHLQLQLQRKQIIFTFSFKHNNKSVRIEGLPYY